MGNKTNERTTSYQIYPIGYVRSDANGSYIEILEPFRPALEQLNQFGHAIVLWWADRHDRKESRSIMQCMPPYAEDKVTGVFACRSEYRPNPVAITVCPLLHVDPESGVVRVPYMDAFEGTPVVDLKAYFPVCDRVREVKVPAWVEHWPEWVEDGHLLTF